MGEPFDRSRTARAREAQIDLCGLPRHLKAQLSKIYRHGDWATGERIRVSNATLAKQLSIGRRQVQINNSALINLKVLVVEGLVRSIRRRDGSFVRSARRGGPGRANEYRIDFDALPPPVVRTPEGVDDGPSLLEPLHPPNGREGRSPDHPTVGRSPDRPYPPQGRSPDGRKGDLEIAPSSDRQDDRERTGRTATAVAVAYQLKLWVEGVPPLDQGSVRLTAKQRHDLAREPNGTNAKAIRRQVFELLKHPEEARRLLRVATPLVWTNEKRNPTAAAEAYGNLIEATRRRCAELGIACAVEDGVPIDIVERQVRSAWGCWFGRTRRPRDGAPVEGKPRSRGAPRGDALRTHNDEAARTLRDLLAGKEAHEGTGQGHRSRRSRRDGGRN